jgi:hypothetical protein
VNATSSFAALLRKEEVASSSATSPITLSVDDSVHSSRHPFDTHDNALECLLARKKNFFYSTKLVLAFPRTSAHVCSVGAIDTAHPQHAIQIQVESFPHVKLFEKMKKISQVENRLSDSPLHYIKPQNVGPSTTSSFWIFPKENVSDLGDHCKLVRDPPTLPMARRKV